MDVVSDILEVLRVSLDEELPEESKVGMVRVVHLHEAPGVLAYSDRLAGNLENSLTRIIPQPMA